MGGTASKDRSKLEAAVEDEDFDQISDLLNDPDSEIDVFEPIDTAPIDPYDDKKQDLVSFLLCSSSFLLSDDRRVFLLQDAKRMLDRMEKKQAADADDDDDNDNNKDRIKRKIIQRKSSHLEYAVRYHPMNQTLFDFILDSFCSFDEYNTQQQASLLRTFASSFTATELLRSFLCSGRCSLSNNKFSDDEMRTQGEFSEYTPMELACFYRNLDVVREFCDANVGGSLTRCVEIAIARGKTCTDEVAADLVLLLIAQPAFDKKGLADRMIPLPAGTGTEKLSDTIQLDPRYYNNNNNDEQHLVNYYVFEALKRGFSKVAHCLVSNGCQKIHCKFHDKFEDACRATGEFSLMIGEDSLFDFVSQTLARDDWCVDLEAPLGENNNGRTALQHALGSAQPRLCRVLIEYGANHSNCKDPLVGQIPLHIAAGSKYASDIETLKFFVDIHLKNGDDLNKLTDSRGQSALHYAVASGHCDRVELLLKHGLMNPNIVDDKGESLLVFSIKQIPQMDLCEGDLQITELLLQDFGADPNLYDGNGEAALHEVCSRFCDEDIALYIATILLQNGALPDALNTRDTPKTPIDYACEFMGGQPRLVALLRECVTTNKDAVAEEDEIK